MKLEKFYIKRKYKERKLNERLTDHEHRYYRNSRNKSDVCIICGYNPLTKSWE